MYLATVFSYLDKHQGGFTAILTLCLVGITFYYAIQNRRMVAEMKKARDATILPKLAIDLHALGPNAVALAIKNVGPGAALDIDVRTEWVPAFTSLEVAGKRWRKNLMASGEQVVLFPPGELGGNLTPLTETYREVRLRGELKDVGGRVREVDEAFEDLAQWAKVIHDQAWKNPDQEIRAADAMAKKFEPALKNLAKAVSQIADAIKVA
jgi:hypothetical protein